MEYRLTNPCTCRRPCPAEERAIPLLLLGCRCSPHRDQAHKRMTEARDMGDGAAS